MTLKVVVDPGVLDLLPPLCVLLLDALVGRGLLLLGPGLLGLSASCSKALTTDLPFALTLSCFSFSSRARGSLRNFLLAPSHNFG